ncbi:MAG: hypothetical protein MJ246_05075 [Clostridia bacterium]|nr:hypothetical protein [Clostridia bacterium]
MESLKDVLASLKEQDLEEIACKVNVNYRSFESKELAASEISNVILNNISLLTKIYSKKTLKHLYSACTEDKVNEDLDFNTLYCDGICYIQKEGNEKLVKVSPDLKKAFLDFYETDDAKDKIKVYDELEDLISGIVKVYGVIDSDSIYEVFCDVKLSKEDEFDDEDEFDHFLYSRDQFGKNYDIIEDENGNEYYYHNSIDDPEEALDSINEKDEGRTLLGRADYIKFGKSEIGYATDEKAYNEFSKYILKLTDGDEDKTDDIVNTVMYDIKTNNLDDLMLDIMTYVDMDTEDEHEEIKTYLSNLYENTPTWSGKFLK